LQLIEDNNALTRFIDEFIRQAHDQTLAIIIQLQKKLKNKIIDQPNFNEQTFVRWMQHIKQSKNKFKVFNDVDDEDIRISANLIEFSFHNGAQPDFYSCDNDIIRSLNTIKTKIPELKKILNGKFLKI
jgi:esterase/lipase superfamily enzyme